MIEGQNFEVVPDEERIPPGREDEVMQAAKKLETTLSGLFPVPCRYGTCQAGEYSGRTIVDRLIDTSDTRVGPPPAGQALEQLIRQGDRCVEGNCPLVLVGIYGTPRNLDRPELNRAQLADLSAVMMVQAALDRVHSAHLPGAEYRAVDEDLTALWLDMAQHPKGKSGSPDFKEIYGGYFKERQRLLEVLRARGMIDTGNTKITLLSEADLYEQGRSKKGLTGEAEAQFLADCERVRPVILNYLCASGEIIRQLYGESDAQWIGSEENPELWDKCRQLIMATPEYRALEEVGWQGLIPPEMRKGYLQKFRQILGNAELPADDQLLLHHVSTYLSSTLVKYLAGTLIEGIQPGTPVIKVPLVSPVSGRPESHSALVAQRTIPKGSKAVSNDNRAAWQSVAVQAQGKTRLMPTSQFVQIPEELIVPVQIYVIGGPETPGSSYLVDSAIVLSGFAQDLKS